MKKICSLFIAVVVLLSVIQTSASPVFSVVSVNEGYGNIVLEFSENIAEIDIKDKVYVVDSNGAKLASKVELDKNKITVHFDDIQVGEIYAVVQKNLLSVNNNMLDCGMIYKLSPNIDMSDFSDKETVTEWGFYPANIDTSNDSVYTEVTDLSKMQPAVAVNGQLTHTYKQPSIYVKKDWLTKKYNGGIIEYTITNTKDAMFGTILNGSNIKFNFWQLSPRGYLARFTGSGVKENYYGDIQNIDVMVQDSYIDSINKVMKKELNVPINTKLKIKSFALPSENGITVKTTMSYFNETAGEFEDEITVAAFTDADCVFNNGYMGFICWSNSQMLVDYIKITGLAEIREIYTTNDVIEKAEEKIQTLISMTDEAKVYENINIVDNELAFLTANGIDISSLNDYSEYLQCISTYNKFKIINVSSKGNSAEFSFSKTVEDDASHYIKVFDNNGQNCNFEISVDEATGKIVTIKFTDEPELVYVSFAGDISDKNGEKTLGEGVWYECNLSENTYEFSTVAQLKVQAENNIKSILGKENLIEEDYKVIAVTDAILSFLSEEGVENYEGKTQYAEFKKELNKFKLLYAEVINESIVLNFSKDVNENTLDNIYVAFSDGESFTEAEAKKHTGKKVKIDIPSSILKYIKAGKKPFVVINSNLQDVNSNFVDKASVVEFLPKGFYDNFENHIAGDWKWINIDSGIEGKNSTVNISDIERDVSTTAFGNAVVKNGKIYTTECKVNALTPQRNTAIAPLNSLQYDYNASSLEFELVCETKGNVGDGIAVLTRTKNVKAVSKTDKDEQGVTVKTWWQVYADEGYGFNCWRGNDRYSLYLQKYGENGALNSYNDGKITDGKPEGVFPLANTTYEFKEGIKYKIRLETLDNEDGSVFISLKVAEITADGKIGDFKQIISYTDDGTIGGKPYLNGSFAFYQRGSYKGVYAYDNIAYFDGITIGKTYNLDEIKNITNEKLSALEEVTNNDFEEIKELYNLIVYLNDNNIDLSQIPGAENIINIYAKFPAVNSSNIITEYNKFKVKYVLSLPLMDKFFDKQFVKVAKDGVNISDFNIVKKLNSEIEISLYNDKNYDSVYEITLSKDVATEDGYSIQKDSLITLNEKDFIKIYTEEPLVTNTTDNNYKVEVNFKNPTEYTQKAVGVIAIKLLGENWEKYVSLEVIPLNIIKQDKHSFVKEYPLEKGNYEVSAMICENLESLKQMYRKNYKLFTVEGN